MSEQKPMNTGEALEIVYELALLGLCRVLPEHLLRANEALDILHDLIANNFEEEDECQNSL